MAIENGDRVLSFLIKQRDEDVKREDLKHKEILELIANTSKDIVHKIDAHALETDIQFKKHDKYHSVNEPIWSYNIFKWLNEHKKLIFISGILIGSLLIVSGAYLGFNWKDILKEVAKNAR